MATNKPRFLVTIEDELKKEWEDEAERQGISLSKFVIQMVEKGRSVEGSFSNGCRYILGLLDDETIDVMEVVRELKKKYGGVV